MAQVTLQFDTELDFFLPPHQKQEAITHIFEGRVSIKDMIESFGVPHTEVNIILVNGKSVDFAYIVQDGDEINVYSITTTNQTISTNTIQPQPLVEPKFILDIHLGKLANALRMLGFDTLYRNDYADEELAEISSQEQRILLTRDRGVLKRSIVTYGYYVRKTDPMQQLLEVLRRFDLKKVITPFHRCIRCNGLLTPISKEAIIEQLPPKVQSNYDEFHRCQSCQQIFWKGSHYIKMQEFIEELNQIC